MHRSTHSAVGRIRTAAVPIALTVLMLGGVAACSDSSEAYCDTVQTVGKSDVLTNADYSDLKAIQETESQVGQIVEVAPDEIKPDWEQIQQGIRVSAKLLQGASQDDAKVRSGFVTLQKVNESTRSVVKDVKDRCNFDISPTL